VQAVAHQPVGPGLVSGHVSLGRPARGTATRHRMAGPGHLRVPSPPPGSVVNAGRPWQRTLRGGRARWLQ
jgi:hypothetical protein